MHRAFKFFYVVRRVLFCSVAFFSSTVIWQIGGAQFLNLAFILYAAGTRPLAGRFMNRIEVFNEATVTICTVHMILFTDWVGGEEMQHDCGYSMLAVVFINIAVNMFVVVAVSAR